MMEESNVTEENGDCNRQYVQRDSTSLQCHLVSARLKLNRSPQFILLYMEEFADEEAIALSVRRAGS
jgi:hypothetical protein